MKIAAVRGRVRAGMTLIEILAAIFILGMGLIMVAASFPVALSQTQGMKDETQSAMAARSAMAVVRSLGYARGLAATQIINMQSATPFGNNSTTVPETWRVWNPQRAQSAGYNEAALWPPQAGDFVWRAFLTRVTEPTRAPVFRVTIVMVKFSVQTPELYDPTLPAAPGLRQATVTSVAGKTLTGAFAAPTTTGLANDHSVVAGDYVMDPLSGLCYAVASATDTSVVLETTPSPLLAAGKYYIFRNVVGIYYSYMGL